MFYRFKSVFVTIFVVILTVVSFFIGVTFGTKTVIVSKPPIVQENYDQDFTLKYNDATYASYRINAAKYMRDGKDSKIHYTITRFNVYGSVHDTVEVRDDQNNIMTQQIVKDNTKKITDNKQNVVDFEVSIPEQLETENIKVIIYLFDEAVYTLPKEKRTYQILPQKTVVMNIQTVYDTTMKELTK